MRSEVPEGNHDGTTDVAARVYAGEKAVEEFVLNTVSEKRGIA